jgi:dTDP-4-amino-4,6-dideoxy-D-galactose acyltransferase
MEAGIEALLINRKDVLAYYNPYVFLKEFELAGQNELFIREKIKQYDEVDQNLKLHVTVDNLDFVFLYEFLPWDSEHFHRNCYRLFTVLYSQPDARALKKAISIFKETLRQAAKMYCFAEIPAEDIFLIQCLNESGVRLVETRLYYFKTNLQSYTEERYQVRNATGEDVPVLSKVAAACRNNYDRVHADPSFTKQEADHYLATYAASAVKGFCDHVLVPYEHGLPVSSFLAFNVKGNILPENPLKILKVNLAAVGLENRGWLLKLLSEAIHFAVENTVSYVVYPTQATTKAAIRTCEKLGFRLGQTNHILAFSS